jgi:exodeoxyribonuclease-5
VSLYSRRADDSNFRCLSHEQRAVTDEIAQFLRSDRQTFILHGAAGTGKTHLLASVARTMPHAMLCAPTGKASFILRERTGLDASTVHSLLFTYAGERRDRNRSILSFIPRYERGALRGKLLLLDEAGMVAVKLAGEIVDMGARIVAACDPDQLGPVDGRSAFQKADATLTEIHRQAWDSPIIRQAHAVREGRPYAADGDAFHVANIWLEDHWRNFDAILVHRHVTRREANHLSRAVRGFNNELPPQPGEPMLCLRNAPAFGVWNGGVYALRDYDPARYRIVLEVDGREVAIPQAVIWDAESADLGGFNTGFDFGYALTVHKAQGSEWPSVLLIDEYPKDDPLGRRRWLYTAITRAVKKIVVSRRL